MGRAGRIKTLGWMAIALAFGLALTAQAAAPTDLTLSSPPSAPTAQTPPAAPTPPETPTPPKNPPPTPQESLVISLLGIKATKETKPQIDPALQPVADALPMSKYNSFRLIVSDARTVAVGSSATFPLTEGYSIRVDVEKASSEIAQITISWIRAEAGAKAPPPKAMKITIRKGKYFLSGGWELKEGALFAAVAVK
jgi:hypothetical protein